MLTSELKAKGGGLETMWHNRRRYEFFRRLGLPLHQMLSSSRRFEDRKKWGRKTKLWSSSKAGKIKELSSHKGGNFFCQEQKVETLFEEPEQELEKEGRQDVPFRKKKRNSPNLAG